MVESDPKKDETMKKRYNNIISYKCCLIISHLYQKGGRTMNKMNSIVLKVGAPLCALALSVGVTSIGTTCFGWFHQPKVPTGMKKYKK